MIDGLQFFQLFTNMYPLEEFFPKHSTSENAEDDSGSSE